MWTKPQVLIGNERMISMKERKFTHPYIPNSYPEVQKQMMDEIGIDSIYDLFSEIPEELRFRGKMEIPEPILSEAGLVRHMEKILSRNQTVNEFVSFLGAGCYQHYVPAICDEIASRSEFLTAYAGEPYEDHGRFQALFEYQSMMGELLDMDVCNVPTYDWCQAAATALRMAGRITGRKKVLVSKNVNPQRLSAIENYCYPVMEVILVDYCSETGCLNLSDLEEKIACDVGAIYFENPNYFGLIETSGQRVADIVHANGSLLVVGVDPITLGVLAPPSQYGADIAVGDVQTLGIHMNYGGGMAGFIASQDREEFVAEYPSRLFGIAHTEVPGEWGFGDVFYDRTSFAKREEGKEFVGTAAALWGITAGVYLALMGPYGMEEIGKTVMQKSLYAAKEIGKLKGVRVNDFGGCFFKEFLVNFDGTGLAVRDINESLREKGILGGKDLSLEFPELGETALYCVTEVHTEEDILALCRGLDQAIQELKEVGSK